MTRRYTHIKERGEAPLCACGCKKKVNWRANGGGWSKFIWGHNSCTSIARKRKRKQIKQQRKNPKFTQAQKKSGENRRGVNHHAWVPLELRICACGCNKTFECKSTSKQKYIYNHHFFSKRGCPLSKKTREKIRKAQKGKPRPQTSGENHWQYGKHPSEETREKIRKSLSKYHKSHPKEMTKNTRNMIKFNKKHRIYKKGKDHPGWKGGPNSINSQITNQRRHKKFMEGVKNLEDSYIKGLLCTRSDLKQSDIPLDLIELERLQLKLYRLIKKGT